MSEFEEELRRYRPVPAPESLWRRVAGLPPRNRRFLRPLVYIGAVATVLVVVLVFVVSRPVPPGKTTGEEEVAKQALDALVSRATKAGSLRVRFTCTMEFTRDGQEHKTHTSGTFLVKKGGKFSFIMDVSRDGRTRDLHITSDGETMRDDTSIMGPDRSEWMGKDMIEFFVRHGAFPAQMILTGPPGLGTKGPAIEAREFRLSNAEGGLKVLSFRVAPPNLDRPGKGPEVKLWFDPATSRPVRRTIESPGRLVVEVYEEYSPGVEIPDSEFQL